MTATPRTSINVLKIIVESMVLDKVLPGGRQNFIVLPEKGEQWLYQANHKLVSQPIPQDFWVMWPSGRLVGNHLIPLDQMFSLYEGQQFQEVRREPQVLHPNGLVYDDLYYSLAGKEGDPCAGCVRMVSKTPYLDTRDKFKHLLVTND